MTGKRKVYISGGMTGVKDFQNNFLNAEKKLINDGYTVVNPVYVDEILSNGTYEDFMKIDLFLLDMCDCIYMLKDWEKSRGANREYGYALAKGLEIIFQ